MSLTSTAFRIQYSPNGSTTEFAFPYRFLANSHLVVTLTEDGTDTVLALDTDYTVDGAGSATGGTITIDNAPASGSTLTIERIVPLTQEVDYVTNDGFPSESHEAALDKLTMAVQQIDGKAARSIRQGSGETPVLDMVLPSAADRASKALGFNATGALTMITLDPSSTYLTDVWVLTTTLLSAVDDSSMSDGQIVGCTCFNTKGDDGGGFFYLDTNGVAGNADNGMTFASLSGYLWRRIVQDRRINVKWYGAIGNGSTDDQPAIQAAVNGLIEHFGGGELYFPKGTYYLGSFNTGDITNGGEFLTVGNQLATIPGIQIYGPGAVLKTVVDPGDSSGSLRKYTLLAVYDAVQQFSCEGVDFWSAATTVTDLCHREGVRFIPTASSRPFKQVKFYNCTFRNLCRSIHLDALDGDLNLQTTTNRFEFVHIDSCSFTYENGADSGGDESNVTPEVSVLCYENCDNIEVTNNRFDGCLSTDISGNVNRRPWDGFLFLRQPTRAIITGNICQHFDKEAIFVIGNYNLINKPSYECIVANNIINATSPYGHNLDEIGQVGIRVDVPFAVIEGNSIRDVNGLGICCVVEGGSNYPYEVKISNNQIVLRGSWDIGGDGDIGVRCNYGRAVIESNSISCASYDGHSPRVMRGVYVSGGDPDNGQSIIRNNKIWSDVKLSAGSKEFIGIEVTQGGTGTSIIGNVFRNINTGVRATAGSYPRLVVDENEFINLDTMMSGQITFTLFRRNHIIFTPTAPGWYRIGVGAFGFRGRFTVSTDVPYGDPLYASRMTSYADFSAVLSCNNSGVPTHTELIQHAFTYFNSPAFSSVRFFDTNNVELKIDDIGDWANATPIVVTLESGAQGMYPQFPTLNESSGVTNALLNFGPGARISDRDNSTDAIDNLIKVGSYYLWVDATDKLRIKSSAPSSITDGTIVGEQTA